MAQLVGSRCALCQEMVGSVIEGDFCPACHGPYHYRCRRPTTGPAELARCVACGRDLSARLAAQAERERAAAVAKERRPITRVHTAVVCLELIEATSLGVCAWGFLLIPGRPDRDLALYLGGVFLGLLAFVQVVAYGLYKGQPWARLPAMAILVLSVPSVGLPFGIIGLIMLWNDQLWEEYVARRRAAPVEQSPRLGPRDM